MANYCDNATFLSLIKQYKANQSRKVYNEIGKIFLSIAVNFLNKPSFINYSQDRKDEMISEATFMMCRYLDRYDDIKYTNPHSYFTETAKNAMLQMINMNNKLKDRYINLSFIENFDKVFETQDFVE